MFSFFLSSDNGFFLFIHFRFIDGQTMSSLSAVYELTLHHNPWRCDCTMRTFREWMIEHRIPLSYSPNCTTPERLFGRTWSQLDLDEFACAPIVISVDTEVVVYEGKCFRLFNLIHSKKYFPPTRTSTHTNYTYWW